MATVITPVGERLEGVDGDALRYYKGLANTGEDYQILPDAEPVADVVEEAPPPRPADSAKKADWAQYAIDTRQSGLTVEELVDSMTQDELVAKFGDFES